jgi:hypothetical protein
MRLFPQLCLHIYPLNLTCKCNTGQSLLHECFHKNLTTMSITCLKEHSKTNKPRKTTTGNEYDQTTLYAL